jgi:hypothetical protein
MTALMLAAAKGHALDVKTLLEGGADPRQMTPDTPNVRKRKGVADGCWGKVGRLGRSVGSGVRVVVSLFAFAFVLNESMLEI